MQHNPWSRSSIGSRDTVCPLCVDLDGTLIRGDMFLETALEAVRDKPLSLVQMLPSVWRGRAWLKRRLARTSRFDPAHLPYDERLVDYLHGEHASGRMLVLATASDELVARRIADHLKLFDKILASDGRRNLKGNVKREILVRYFGENAFSYAGNDKSDFAVWRSASSAITVNAPRHVVRTAARLARIEADFPPEGNKLVELGKALRLYQWVKNGLVFLPAILAHRLLEPPVAVAAATMFIAFSLAASGCYILNDLLDLPSDRANPRKRGRPFACGSLPVSFAGFGPVLILLGISLGFTANWQSGALVSLYVLLTTLYSTVLKQKVLVDVFMLATLYTMRLFSGSVATSLTLSNWLLTFSGFTFLALAVMKRCAELWGLHSRGLRKAGRRGYSVQDLDILRVIGVTSSFVAALVLALYVDTDMARGLYGKPDLLWVIVPVFLFWICRLWLSTERGQMHDDPIIFTSRDWVSQLCGTIMFVAFLLASLGW